MVAIAPLPFSPVKFSGLIERDLACESRNKLPMSVPKPLNGASAAKSGSAGRQSAPRVRNREGSRIFMGFYRMFWFLGENGKIAQRLIIHPEGNTTTDCW